jgi:hypothetical protein
MKRRGFLRLVIAAAFAVVAGPPGQGELELRGGWILRRDDG